MLPIEAYMCERDRPCAWPAFYQRWRDLLFLHFATEPDLLAPLLPAGLELDTHPDEGGREMAWVGLVPFRMEGIRARGLPRIPTAHAFPETNVRTYVHRDGRPGVWFFSLEATSALACRFARGALHLPYRESEMTVSRRGDVLSYESRRRDGATVNIEAEVLGESQAATPGSLEFFLIERYLLFAHRGAGWFAGNVHHPPYPVRAARVIQCAETLVEACGIAGGLFTHRMFSEGVDVRIGSLRRLGEKVA